MIFYALTVLIGFLGTLGLLIACAFKSPKIGILALLFSFLLDMTFQGIPPSFGILTFNTYPADLILGILGVAGILRWITRRSARPPELVLMLGAILIIAILRGLGDHSLQLVINSSRNWLYIVAVLIYCSSIEWTIDKLEWFRATWLNTSLILLLIGVAWFVLNFLGIATYSVYQGTFRFLPSSGALFLAEGAIMGLVVPTRRSSQRLGPGLLLLAVVVLQHRTVWLCVLAALLVLPLLDWRRAGRIVLLLCSIGLLGTALIPFLAPQLLLGSLEDSATSTGTFLWRLDGWVQLLSRERFPDVVNVLFGQTMGAGYERVVAGEVVTASPHNHYIQAVLDIGILGLVAYVLIILSPLRREVKSLGYFGTAMALIAVYSVVYSGTYSIPYPTAIFLGLAISTIISKKSHTNPIVRREYISIRKD